MMRRGSSCGNSQPLIVQLFVRTCPRRVDGELGHHVPPNAGAGLSRKRRRWFSHCIQPPSALWATMSTTVFAPCL